MNSKTMLALFLCLLPTISFSAKRESFPKRARPTLKPTTIKEPNKFLTPPKTRTLSFFSGVCLGYGTAKGSTPVKYCCAIGTATAGWIATASSHDEDLSEQNQIQAHQCGLALGVGFAAGWCITTAFQYCQATPNKPK